MASITNVERFRSLTTRSVLLAGSIASTSAAAGPSRSASCFARMPLTTSAVIGLPFSNLSPGFSEAVSLSPSCEYVHRSSIRGCGRPSRPKLINVSRVRLVATCWTPALEDSPIASPKPIRRVEAGGASGLCEARRQADASSRAASVAIATTRSAAVLEDRCVRLAFLRNDRDIVNVNRAHALGLRVHGGFLDDGDVLHCTAPLGCAGDALCQRYNRRFISALVTCRRVHVTERGVRGGDAAAGTHGNESAVPALVPRAEPVELLLGQRPQWVESIVDMSGRERLFAREAGTRVERTVGADGVGVAHVHV